MCLTWGISTIGKKNPLSPVVTWHLEWLVTGRVMPDSKRIKTVAEGGPVKIKLEPDSNSFYFLKKSSDIKLSSHMWVGCIGTLKYCCLVQV